MVSTHLKGDNSSLNKKEKVSPIGENCNSIQNLGKRKEAGLDSNGQNDRAEAVKVARGQSSYYKSKLCALSPQFTEPIWRGNFCICRRQFGEVNGLVAYSPEKAPSDVLLAAHTLHRLLHFELHWRVDVLPIGFDKSPPTDANIDLYIFPEAERAEKEYDRFLNEMTCNNLVLTAEIYNNF